MKNEKTQIMYVAAQVVQLDFGFAPQHLFESDKPISHALLVCLIKGTRSVGVS